MIEEFNQLLVSQSPELSAEVRESLSAFYQLVLKENEVQNLTRLVSPADFYYGNAVDVIELLKTGWVEYPIVDMGSGVGIPGIIACLMEGGRWILTESERRKAEYLERAVTTLNLGEKATVFAGRAEDFLKNQKVNGVVARAVGPVERIYTWIQKCSTWNKLILFKGPQWEEEWNHFLGTKFRDDLQIEAERSYLLGPEKKIRKIILLKRVPRGT